MIIERLLSPVHSLGPGERVCLWTRGCSKNCPGCISPELQNPEGNNADERILAQILIQVAKAGGCDGLTVSGGDPFEQPESLLLLLSLVREHFKDILVYTGYTLEEIKKGKALEAGIRCLEYIDVLIDGRYVKAKNRPDCILRGSTNQKIHFLNDENKKRSSLYEEYMKKGRIIESFVHNDCTVLTGILNED